MNFKNNAFTLIEVMLAMAIAASMMTAIFILQSGALAAVLRYSTDYMRMVHAKNFLLDTRRKREESKNPKQFKLEKKEDEPETFLRYSFGDVKETTLKSFDNLYIEKVDIAHEARQKEPNATLFTLIYMPEQKQ
jgi:prepilin-type N-terminal cleavage/methylation domain-containing protein